MEKDELEARARSQTEEAVRRRAHSRGKIQIMPKCDLRGPEDFAVWYTPCVVAVCRAIQAEQARVYDLTNKANSVAIVTDGTCVLGLGDIGPEAGLPVMEGKALLFKYLGDVDAMPVWLATRDADELVRTVALLEPRFGGVNLEDIAQQKCFRILEAVRATMKIPVWHYDQQGSATALLAGLANALKVMGKSLPQVRIAMIGMGAVIVSVYRLLTASGANPGAIVACDSKGVLHPGRGDFPNQLNNFLMFPALFRGTLDVGASTISDEMALAAAGEIARCADERGLREDFILPRMDDPELVPRVAAATALKSRQQGIARAPFPGPDYLRQTSARIARTRDAVSLLQRAALLVSPA